MLVFFCILALRLQHINWNVVISENKFAFHLIGIINQTELSKHIRRKTNLWIQKKERKQNLTRATICLNQQIDKYACSHACAQWWLVHENSDNFHSFVRKHSYNLLNDDKWFWILDNCSRKQYL